MNTTLFTMLGHPGSGKSHFAKQLAVKLNAVWLNNDGMRSSIFDDPMKPENLHNYPVIYGAIDYAAHQVLAAGYSVVYDANVNHYGERQKNSSIAESHNALAIVLWVKTSVDEAVRRVENREVTAEQFRFTKDNVLKHIARLEEPSSSEKCIIIDGTLPFSEQFLSFNAQMKQLVQ